MSMMDAVKSVFSKYATFSGRARRSEFWWFFLFNFIIGAICGAIGRAIGTNVIGSIWSLVVLVPSLALAVRRLHDTGKSGWAILINLIPLVGWIIYLVWICSDSQPNNQYGPSPKANYNNMY